MAVRSRALLLSLAAIAFTLNTSAFSKDKKKPAVKTEAKEEQKAPTKDPAKDATPAATTPCIDVPADAQGKQRECKTQANDEYVKCMKDMSDKDICKGVCDGYLEQCLKN